MPPRCASHLRRPFRDLRCGYGPQDHMREVAALLPLLLYVILKPVGPLAQVQPPGRRADTGTALAGSANAGEDLV